MDLQSYLPALHQHGLITWQQALAAGLTPEDVRRLLASGQWVLVRRGVYADRAAWEALDPFRGQPLLRIHAARLTIQLPHVVSHDSAALLLGLGVPDPRTALVHVTRPRVLGRRTEAGIKHHGAPYAADLATTVDGIPVLGLARTALDMAREHGRDHGLAACDAALRRGVSRAELRQAVESMHHWRGVRAVREAIDLADPLAETYIESLGRGLVLDLGLGRPECQFGLTDGARKVWCDIRVGRHIFEPDGRLKYFLATDPRTPEEVLWEEKKRQDFITGFKLGVSRITMHDCLAGRAAALRRLAREYAATVARFGTDIGDLAPYVVRRQAC